MATTRGSSGPRTIQRSFNAGEISPEMFGRFDDTAYQSGLARCRNFIVKPHGPVENRPGFEFVRAVKTFTRRTRLIPFTYSTTQTMVIELGAGYFRFHTQGATLMNGDSPYEISNPYAETDLFDIHYVQSADVLTLAHPGYAPRELRRLGALNWSLVAVDFLPPINPPSAPTLSTNITTTKYTYTYVVTAISADGVSESAASTSANIASNLFETGGKVTISWGAVTGASRYNIYKLQGGLYGYIGQTTGLSIEDDNIAPDMGQTPPLYETVFGSAGNYPGAVSYFEQRRCFAGTNNRPQNIWMTRSGTESDLSYSLPTRDDDRIAFRVAAREANTIRHIVPLGELLLLTSSAEWRVTSVNSDAITPSTISVRPQSYVGASNVQPAIINNTLLYAAARGGHVREMAYNWQANGYLTGDLSLRSPHLFDNYDITDMAYAKAPQPIVWFISTSGRLLGLTYVPEQKVGAWHWHDTDGQFESIAVVAEGDEDRLYAVVRRFINGQWVRYVERMASRHFEQPEQARFLDASATYDGPPATFISGLQHLEGKTVSILADGAVMAPQVVQNGSITLEVAARVVHVGLPYVSDMQTLPIAVELMGDGAFAQGRYKNVNRVWLRVYRSSGIFVGPDEDELVEAQLRTDEPYGSPPRLKTEDIEVTLHPTWADTGQVLVRQTDPLPLTVVSLTAEVSLGG